MQLRMFSRLNVLCLAALFPGAIIAQELVPLARSGDLPALMAALPEGSDPDPEKLSQALYFASQRGHGEVVSYLLSMGATPNSVTHLGTALGIAARQNHIGIVADLLDAGADPGLPGGEDGRLPLDQAAERGAVESARLLLEHGADVNAVTARYGWPAIHFAASKGRTEMVAFLQAMGASPIPVDSLTSAELEAADLNQGRLVALECEGCHNITPGETGWRQNLGPDLVGVVGRPKASLEDFPYSDAMRAQSGRWTPEELNVFLADPFNVGPGTNMGRGGQRDRAARIAVIAYLTGLKP